MRVLQLLFVVLLLLLVLFFLLVLLLFVILLPFILPLLFLLINVGTCLLIFIPSLVPRVFFFPSFWLVLVLVLILEPGFLMALVAMLKIGRLLVCRIDVGYVPRGTISAFFDKALTSSVAWVFIVNHAFSVVVTLVFLLMLLLPLRSVVMPCSKVRIASISVN